MSSWEEVTDTEAHDKSGEQPRMLSCQSGHWMSLDHLTTLHHSELFLTNISIQSTNLCLKNNTTIEIITFFSQGRSLMSFVLMSKLGF